MIDESMYKKDDGRSGKRRSRERGAPLFDPSFDPKMRGTIWEKMGKYAKMSV